MIFKRLPKSLPVPGFVTSICQTLRSSGYQAYVVGGGVRDALRGETPKDWDIATDAEPSAVEKLFPETIPTGKRFGTITVRESNHLIEVTTFRQDADYSDGRRPDSVRYSNDIHEDLRRRDFTINAIAYDPLEQNFVDPHQGLRDIHRRLLRTVGDPTERFREDALRMLRMLRLAAVLRFKIHRTARSAIHSDWIASVSLERIRDELSLLLPAKNLAPSLTLMHESGLLRAILPELADCVGVNQGNRHKWDVFFHSVRATEIIKPELHLRLAALLHDMAKPKTRTVQNGDIHFYGHDELGETMVTNVLSRLRFSNRLIQKTALLVRHHMFQIQPDSSPKAIRRFIAKVGRDSIYDVLELRRADALAMRIQPRQTHHYFQLLYQRVAEVLAEDHVFTVQDLAVNGYDLMEFLQIPPGPYLGDILDFLFDHVMEDPNDNRRKVLLQIARDYHAAHESSESSTRE